MILAPENVFGRVSFLCYELARIIVVSALQKSDETQQLLNTAMGDILITTSISSPVVDLFVDLYLLF